MYVNLSLVIYIVCRYHNSNRIKILNNQGTVVPLFIIQKNCYDYYYGHVR